MKGVDVKNMNKDDRTRFTLRLPKELFSLLQEDANKIGVSVNSLILQILWSYVEDNKA